MTANHDSPGALAGFRVLDLTGPMGVYCGKLLADLGADVLRVEPPAGDAARRLGPYYQNNPGVERSLFHWHFNANKRGVTLDISKDDGQALLKRLAQTADVMLDTFQPGRLDELGLGYDELSALNPGIVMTSITPFGQEGPYRDFLGDELIGQAAGGLLWACGWPDRPPVMMGGWPAMHQASAEAASATLLALHFRELTGEGQFVDVSVQAGLPKSNMMAVWQYYHTGIQTNAPAGDGHNTAVYGMFACKDGYVDFRMTGRAGQWERFVAWLEMAGMAEDLVEERWRDGEFRRQPENSRHIDEVFQRFLLQLGKEEAMDGAQRLGIQAGAVYTPEDLFCDPQLQARDFFVEIAHEDLGASFRYPGAPYRLSRTPWSLKRRAPRLGEHNLEVYTGELGLSAEQLQSLRASSVI